MQFLLESPKSHKFKGLQSLIFISASISIIYLIVSSVLVPNSNSKLSVSLQDISSPTSLDHIVFGIASNNISWPQRKHYVRLWWKPNRMRGCVFLNSNTTLLDQDDTDYFLPPMCISGDTSKFRYTYRGGLRSAIRVARVVSETVALNYTNVRWFVFGDDDTVFFPENLIKVLSKYDHNLWYYIGSNSESYTQNKFFSFEMAYGGGGFAISYPLAKVLAKNFDSCMDRYPYLYGSDGRISSCLAELGVSLTKEPGFHQLDMRGNIFGLLAAHPLAPLVSLHHLDIMDPIFPNMTSKKALEHLYEAANYDPHRIVQQTVCFDRWFSWTVSVSWGYAVQVYGRHVPLPYMLRAEKTFKPFKKGNYLNYYFNLDVRDDRENQCRRPAVFFMDQVFSEGGKMQSDNSNGIQSIYRKLRPDNCTRDLGSPHKLEEIRVFSQKYSLGLEQLAAPRRQCCDILPSTGGKLMEIAIRECGEEEMTYLHS
ncbi:DUF604 domain-containing protein [Heracleum sosnowskyi]|uniref:DUF604 domain-containing protein n=1 Tax=Heracleum sosnowskyi TaxID=360622 RepID=A0AAD8IRA4_9APIA|nr:DUF604 domain-containing protein [Heracleum sosnowskyi]